MRKFKRFIVALLIVAMTFDSSVVTSLAVELDTPMVSENDEQEEIVELDSEDSISSDELDDEDEFLEEDELETEEIEEKLDEETDEEIDELPSEESVEEVFYRNLETEEIEAKEQLSQEVDSVMLAEEGTDYIANEVYAVCDTEEEAQSIADAYSEATGYTVKIKSYYLGVAVFGLYGQKKADETNAKLRSMNRVEYVLSYAEDIDNNLPAVHANGIKHTCSVPNYEHFTDPFLDINNKPNYQIQHDPINDKYAWTKLVEKKPMLLTDSEKIVVAVIDSGVADHVDLKLDTDSFSGFTEYDDPSETTYADRNGHGTNVAGIIGAKANTIGGRGVAPGVTILAAKGLDAEGNGTDATVARAIKGVIDLKKGGKNIKVVNMSLGGPIYNSEDAAMLKEMHDLGMTVVVAAGNDNTQMLEYPAGYNDVICVAALKSDYTKANFSNYGNHVKIAAPGGNYGVGVEELLSTGIAGNGELIDGNYYNRMGGTSQATPVVAGVVALLSAYTQYDTPDEILDRLQSTAIPVKSTGVGAGCVDAMAALGLTAPSLDVIVCDEVDNIIDDNSSISFDTNLKFSIDDGEYAEDAAFYYTLNGKNPDPLKMVETGTKVVECDEAISIDSVDASKLTLKVLPVLYGTEGSICTLTLNNSDLSVSDIKIDCKTNPDKSGYYYVTVGKTLQLMATALPTYASNKKLEWESSDTSIATVTATGSVKGLSNGSVDIIVKATDSDSPFSKTVRVKVVPVAQQIEVMAKGVSMPLSSIDLKETETYEIADLDIKTYPSNVSRSFTYKSSNAKVAAVDAEGVITALSSGKAEITVSTTDGSNVKDTFTVNVTTDLRSLDLKTNMTYDELSVGQTMKFTPVFNGGQSVPDDINLSWDVEKISGSIVSWDFDDKTKSLKVTSIGSGTSRVRVTATGYNMEGAPVAASKEIEVFEKTKSIDSKYGSNNLNYPCYLEQDVDLMYSIYPTNANPRLVYSSSNPKVLTIDEEGIIRAVGLGKASISAKAIDGSNKGITFNFNVLDKSVVYDNVLGLKSKNDVEVLYPGKKVTYDVVSNASSWNSDFDYYYKNYLGFGVYLENIDYDYYVSYKGRTITANNELKYIGSVIETTAELWWGGDVIHSVPIELYPSAVSSIDLNGDNTISLGIGEKFKLNPKAIPVNSCQKYMTYTTSNAKVAKVYKDGTIEAVGNGKANITVTAGDGSGKKAVCAVTVAQPVTEITIAPKNGASSRLGGGAKLSLIATTNADAANKKVTWALKNPDDSRYAKVDASGNVTADKNNVVAEKDVVVVATAADGSGTKEEYTVRVIPSAKEIKASTPKLTIYTEDRGTCLRTNTVAINAVTNAGTLVSDEDIEVTSSNSSIATATFIPESRTLEVTGNKAGTANIKISATDGSKKSATVSVTVKKAVSDITVANAKGSTSVAIGKSIPLTAKTNADASDKKVTWRIDTSNLEGEVNNTSLIKISASGSLSVDKSLVYTGLSRGYVTVIATALDGSGISGSTNITINDQAVGKIEATNRGSLITTKDKLSLCTGSDIGDLTNSTELLVKHYYGKNPDAEECTDFAYSSSNASILKVEKSTTHDNGLIVTALKAGNANVTITSGDGAAKTTVNFIVVDPVRTLKARAKKDEHYVVVGSSFDVEAVTNANVTNKKVTWDLPMSYPGVKISPTGKITIDKNCESSIFKAIATATDGSLTSAETDNFIVVNKYNNIVANVVSGGREIKPTGCTISKGETVVIELEPDEPNACGEYRAFYTKTNGYVQYGMGKESIYPERPNLSTKIIVTGTNKGTIPITIKATDNSGKSKTFTVTVK